MRKSLLVALAAIGPTFLYAQSDAWVPVTPGQGVGQSGCWQTRDLIIDARDTSKFIFNRFGILHRGLWGSYNSSGGVNRVSQYITLGPCDIGRVGVGPSSNRLYGYYSSMNTDRIFVGLRIVDTGSNLCVTQEPEDNNTEAVIAWGQDDGMHGVAADMLKFIFYGETANDTTIFPLVVATMTPQGRVGIGTEVPTTQLHTTAGVRFQGLTSGAVQDLVGIDANGNLFRTSGGGGGNTCATVGMVPKTTNTTGALGCSQIFDNGTSVGINTTSGFGYSSLSSSFTGPALPPTSGMVRLDVSGVTRSLAYIATSDERYKTNIQDIKGSLDIINNLNGKSYNWTKDVQEKSGADGATQYGFIAQDVEKVIPDVVIMDDQGQRGINYNAIVPFLVEGEKELYQLYKAQVERNLKLEQELAELKEQIYAVRSCCELKEENHILIENKSKSSLFQNTPNPFSKETTIGYFISDMQVESFLSIFDLNGKEVKRYVITQKGAGKQIISDNAFIPGLYLYSLIVDGNVIDTKKMVVLN